MSPGWSSTAPLEKATVVQYVVQSPLSHLPSRIAALVGVAMLALAAAACPTSVDTPITEPEPSSEPEPEPVTTDVMALAGPDLEALEGTRVVLHAEASRALQGDVTYTWTQLEGPAVLLTNASSAAPAFIAPLAPATLRFRLTVNADYGATHDDDVIVRIVDDAPAPPFFVVAGSDVVVDGSTAMVPLTVRGARVADLSWEATVLCGASATAQVGTDSTGPHLLVDLATNAPACPVVVDARDVDGVFGARVGVVVWPEGQALSLPTQLRANTALVSPDGVLQFDTVPSVGADDALRVWSADGRALNWGDDGVTAPAERTTLLFAGERRTGAASGGVAYLEVEVRDVDSNGAPVAHAGPDRVVAPGSFFSLDTRLSMDPDGDDLELVVDQVIGPNAIVVDEQLSTFQAPDETGIALFHVRAFDGNVYSPPDAVRVTIAEDGGGVPPVVNLPPVLYTVPHQAFVVDGSDAQDPDSGFVDRIVIQQDQDDDVILLPEPAEAASVELTAGSDGDVYHFRVSAFDQEGLSGFVDVEVIVEQAGPYVDPIRGSPEGDGTVDAPFATLNRAVEVASRHRFSTLFLASGDHAVFTEALPPGLSLVGGVTFDGAAYAEGGARSVLPTAGFTVDAAHLSALRLRMVEADARLRLHGMATLVRVDVEGDDVHEGALLEVQQGAVARIQEATVTPRAADTSGGATVVVDGAFVARLIDVTVDGGAGARRVGLWCNAAAIDVVGGAIEGGFGADTGIGVQATGCDVQLLGTELIGGRDVDTGLGAHLIDAVLITDAATTIEGVDEEPMADAAALATAFKGEGDSFVGIASSMFVASRSATLADTTVGVDLQGGRMQLASSTITAVAAQSATGLVHQGNILDLSSTAVTATATTTAKGVWLGDGTALTLADGTVDVTAANAVGLEAADAEGVGTDVVVTVSGTAATVQGVDKAVGLTAPAAQSLTMTSSTLSVEATGAAIAARGIVARLLDATDVDVDVNADGAAVAMRVTGAALTHHITQCELAATSTAATATALQVVGTSTVTSSTLQADGVDGVGLDVDGEATLLHVSARASHLGGHTAATADVTAANSLLHGDVVALDVEGEATLVGLALSGPTLVQTANATAVDEPSLAAVDCQSCRQVTLADVVDVATLRLLDGDNPLVDAAVVGYERPDDVDGQPRDNAADVGADERVVE